MSVRHDTEKLSKYKSLLKQYKPKYKSLLKQYKPTKKNEQNIIKNNLAKDQFGFNFCVGIMTETK